MDFLQRNIFFHCRNDGNVHSYRNIEHERQTFLEHEQSRTLKKPSYDQMWKSHLWFDLFSFFENLILGIPGIIYIPDFIKDTNPGFTMLKAILILFILQFCGWFAKATYYLFFHPWQMQNPIYGFRYCVKHSTLRKIFITFFVIIFYAIIAIFLVCYNIDSININDDNVNYCKENNSNDDTISENEDKNPDKDCIKRHPILDSKEFKIFVALFEKTNFQIFVAFSFLFLFSLFIGRSLATPYVSSTNDQRDTTSRKWRSTYCCQS